MTDFLSYKATTERQTTAEKIQSWSAVLRLAARHYRKNLYLGMSRIRKNLFLLPKRCGGNSFSNSIINKGIKYLLTIRK